MASLTEKIIELYKTGQYKQKDIASICCCSTDTVRRHLIKAGLKETKLSNKLLSIYDDVVRDFNDGLYCKQIAKKYGIEEHSVYKILDKAGIKRQSGYHSNCVENYFEQIDTPNKAYLLGFITADGAIVNEVLSIEINKDDIDLLEFAKSEINPKATITPTRNCVKVTFGAKKLSRDLAKYGIIQNKSKTITEVPIEFIPKDLLPFYFRGLIDGDGCIHTDGKVSIYSGSEQFIKNVQDILCREVGVKKLKIYKGTTYFITWGSYIDKVRLFDYLYKDKLNDTFYYKRKYDRLYNAVYVDTEVNNQIAKGQLSPQSVEGE